MNHGSCLCGSVTWEIDGPLEHMSHCHCARCRKAHGTAFVTMVAGPASGFRRQGGEHVVEWASSPELRRSFCKVCGSTVPGGEWQGLAFAPAGGLDGDPGLRPVAHIFVASKAPWHDITDQLMRFDAYPASIDAHILDDLEPVDAPGAPRGSCLCRAVAFVVESTPIRAHHCHCGRCRKARGAAYASNLFTAADGVRFTRGEGDLTTYKLPQADRFAQVFCRTCGSKMPRINRERGYAVVPMGALDDDPGIRPQVHIFVASKAPWFEITDGLPQFDEAAG